MGAIVDAAAYAGFLRGLGHHVVQTPSGYWYDANRFFYLAAPPHRLYDPPERELRRLLRRPPCLGARFAAPLTGLGKVSYQIVCDNPSYDLEGLSANVRSKVRRGLKRTRIEPVPFAVVAAEGRQAHSDTLARQGRDGVLVGSKWERFWKTAAATPGMEAWGAWVGEVLAAFLVAVRFEDGVDFLLARSRNDELNAYPNNALIFHVTHELLRHQRVPEITFGLEALEPVGPLDQFKFGMGFRPRPLRQRVVFHPVLRMLLRHGAVRSAFRRWAERYGVQRAFWRKAAGLLHLAEEGGL